MTAPLEFKIQSIANRLNINKDQAREIVEENQTYRDDFVQSFLNRDTTDPIYYHMILNNAKMSVDQMTDIIINHIMS